MVEAESMAPAAAPQVIGSGATADPPPEVPPGFIIAVLSRLPPNEVALSGRRTCRAAAQHFAEEHHRTAAMGQPLPPHADGEPLEEAAEAVFRGLSLRRKLCTLSIAAASGSLANLEVAWRLLQPCLFPELVESGFYLTRLQRQQLSWHAGAVAVRSGHIHALSWLLDRCPGLVDSSRALEAAAQHCPLPQLQEAWRMISAADRSLRLHGGVLAAAVESPTPDAIAKMEWVLQHSTEPSMLSMWTAAAAARTGDLARLAWLRERSCPFHGCVLLEAALQHADLSVVEWLVDEAWCQLPGTDPQDATASARVVTSAAASGKVAKLRWLQANGVALLPALTDEPRTMQAAAGSGSLEVVQFLHHLGGDGVLTYWVMAAAAESGSLDVAAYLLKAGCPVQAQAWFRVGQVGNVAMARWLVEAGHLPVTHQYEVLHVWPADRTAEHSRQLLEVVRLVAPPGGSAGEHTMRDASRPSAERGDLDLMRYLHEELGAELWDGALPDAAYGGCEAAIEWLVERGCGAGEAEQLDRCYVRAAASGNLSALECLRRLGVPWSEGLLVQAVLDREVRLPVVQWMWGQGARSGRQELERALAKRRGRKRGDVKEPVVEWLRGQLARPKGSAARARCG